jgi:hypothetical protein
MSILNFLPNAVGQQRPNIISGQVSLHMPAPASFTSPLYVTIPQWQPGPYWTIVNWPALHGGTLPAQGAACLLLRDDRNNLRCVWWDGQFTPWPPQDII